MKTNQLQKNILLDWQEIKLSDVTTKISDGLHTTPKYVENSKYYFINGNNLVNDKIFIDDDTKCVTEDEYIKHKKDLSDESILLGINGTIGNVALYNNEKVILGKSAAYINCTKKVAKKYIFNLLKTQDIQKYFEREVTGSTIKNLSIKSIKSISFSCPLVPEQNRIVSVLETWDKSIEKLSKKIEVKKQIKKGLMQDLLTGKKRLKGFSDKWKIVQLGNIGEFRTSSVDKKSVAGEKEALLCNYMDVYRRNIITNLDTFQKITAKNGQFESSSLVVGDVLFTPSSETPEDIGYSAVVQSTLPNLLHSYHLVRFRPKKNVLDILFSGFCFNQVYFRKYLSSVASGVTRFTLSKSAFENATVPLPSLEEQESIANILTTADKEITELEKKLHILKDQKKYLLNNLVTGTIRTPKTLLAKLAE